MPGVDLHTHSTASDGDDSPAGLVRRAAEADLAAIALTDHDTTDGVAPAVLVGDELSVRVVAGCEFSVAARWGEMHLLGYFLAPDDLEIHRFLDAQRQLRVERAHAIADRLKRVGVSMDVAEILAEAGEGAVGRPHVARALVRRRAVGSVNEAFDKYLASRRPAYVAKKLPSLAEVVALVRAARGVTSAAHLKGRASRATLKELWDGGVDAVEVLHPAHDELTAKRLDRLAGEVGLLRTGGSDWHGDESADPDRAPLGSLAVPNAWLTELERLHRERSPQLEPQR